MTTADTTLAPCPTEREQTQRLCRDDNWRQGYRSEEEDGARAVRWATRDIDYLFSPDWTKWHYTEGNGSFTACGRVVVPFEVDGSPQEREISHVNCRACRAKMAAHGITGAPND